MDYALELRVFDSRSICTSFINMPNKNGENDKRI